MKIESYIKRRKEEDEMNEFDISKVDKNKNRIKSYVDDYFKTYIEESRNSRTVIEKKLKVEKYFNTLSEYDQEVSEWLVGYYQKTGNMINLIANHFLKKESDYLIKNSDEHFDEMTARLTKEVSQKYPEILTEQEMLKKFLTNDHKIRSNYYKDSLEYNYQALIPTLDICEYIKTVQNDFKVNLYAWAKSYTFYYESNDKMWPFYRKKLNTKDFMNMITKMIIIYLMLRKSQKIGCVYRMSRQNY